MLEEIEEEVVKEKRECEENINQRSVLYKKMEKNPWKIIVQNVRGLITANSSETLKLIDDYAKNEKIVLMNFTETWLDKTIKEEADIDGFHTYRCDRTSEISRGGVAIYLYDKIETGQIWEKRFNKCEMIGIEIKELQTIN